MSKLRILVPSQGYLETGIDFLDIQDDVIAKVVVIDDPMLNDFKIGYEFPIDNFHPFAIMIASIGCLWE